MKRLILLSCSAVWFFSLIGQNPDDYSSYPVVFNKEKLQADFIQFRNILESTHPGLYDYSGKEVIDSIFDSNYERIDSDLDFSSFLMLLTEVISRVGCGHSSMWVPRAFWEVAPTGLFPLKIKVLYNKVYVVGTYNEDIKIPAGSELISLNGTSFSSIIPRLTSLTSADGFIEAYRLEKVAQNFSVKYGFAFGFYDNFILEYREPGEGKKKITSLKPVSKALVDKSKPERKELSFRIIKDKNTSLLTINTFGYYSEVDMFHSYIDSVFNVINQKNIENLIIDLRGNSGGDPFCASYLWAYLQPEPLPYFEDHYGRYDTLANPVPKPINHFRGNLFTLIDANGFSTTGHLCGLLKYHKTGKFVGEEMGSTYTCTGNATYPPLDNTGIMVGTARVMRYTAAVKNMDPRRGILPDYKVDYSPQDIIDGHDKTLESALSLINK